MALEEVLAPEASIVPFPAAPVLRINLQQKWSLQGEDIESIVALEATKQMAQQLVTKQQRHCNNLLVVGSSCVADNISQSRGLKLLWSHRYRHAD